MGVGHQDSNISQLLINRYRLVELIGKGAMGKVYRAEDLLLGGVPVAIKFLAQALLNEKMKTRFAHEARTGAQLGQKSIHIVRVLDYGVHQSDLTQGVEVPFYVMEYLHGQSLSELISLQPLPLQRSLKLVRQICMGLHCAHQGISVKDKICPVIHRDIKPSNVLVVPDPSLSELAKVLDFGIATFLSEDSRQLVPANSNSRRNFVGTLAYCSPEQIEGHELDLRSDIYSLGVTMFEMLTGKMPVEAETCTITSWQKAHQTQTPRSFAMVSPYANIPKALEQLVMRCLAKSPSDRPQTVSDILDELQTIEGEVVSTGKIPDAASKSSFPSTETEMIDPLEQYQALEAACWEMTWPVDKPIAEIVFPKIVRVEQFAVPTLWVMLQNQDIQRRLLNTRYNHFLCTMSPHPMVLWITAIFDPVIGARWMPCYLDLKETQSQGIALLLSQIGYYSLLFFAQEQPQQTTSVMNVTIAKLQKQRLWEWVEAGKSTPSLAPPQVSKQLLKTEYEKIKPQLLSKLEAHKTAIRFNVTMSRPTLNPDHKTEDKTETIAWMDGLFQARNQEVD